MGDEVRQDKKIVTWDVAPGKEYFKELFRVSRNQIIWGGNYFRLPPTRCFLIWEKSNIPESFTMAMCEYAWTSFNDNAKIFKYSAANQPGRFHPTQKPVELYKWLLMNYAKNGETILDTHTGSASSLIACRQTNHKYVGFEIDEEYYQKARKRLEAEESQMNLWDLGFNPYQE
jgi:site-specific DNA-methyltransferase (adenine-specific)